MNRRYFLTIGAAGLIAASASSFHLFFESGRSHSIAAEPQALLLIWEDDTIRSVGLHYLNQTPSENKQDTLLALVIAGPGKIESDQESYLEQRIKADFEQGKIVGVDGWILSVTEARQCALFATQLPIVN